MYFNIRNKNEKRLKINYGLGGGGGGGIGSVSNKTGLRISLPGTFLIIFTCLLGWTNPNTIENSMYVKHAAAMVLILFIAFSFEKW